MGSSGSQDPRWQRWIPKTVVLCRVLGSAGTVGTSKDIFFRVPFPDSRLRVKVSLTFNKYNVGGALAPTTSLWLYEIDEIDNSEQTGEDARLTNIVGTSAAPLVIPTDNDPTTPALDPALNGYSREFVSAADYINGRLRVSNDNGCAGWWELRTRYQPQSVSFSPEEWKMIIAHCNPSAPTCALINP